MITCPNCNHEFTEEVHAESTAQKSPLLMLREIEARLRSQDLYCPSRRVMIQMCEDGTWEGKKTRFGYFVFEDSFNTWLSDFQQRKAA
jgi:hypothetical protein